MKVQKSMRRLSSSDSAIFWKLFDTQIEPEREREWERDREKAYILQHWRITFESQKCCIGNRKECMVLISFAVWARGRRIWRGPFVCYIVRLLTDVLSAVSHKTCIRADVITDSRQKNSTGQPWFYCTWDYTDNLVPLGSFPAAHYVHSGVISKPSGD